MVLISISENISCALGALGRRFDPVAPTQSKPSHTSELQTRALFLLVGSTPPTNSQQMSKSLTIH